MTNTVNAMQSRIIMTSCSDDVKYNLDGSVKRTHTNKVAGISSEVYAFNTDEEIQAMINALDKHIENIFNTDTQRQIAVRNKLLFILGINLGIRASDLCSLRWNFFFEESNCQLSFREWYTIMPKKTANKRKFVKLFFNDAVKKAIMEYITVYPIKDMNDYLFKSRKGNNYIEERSIWRIIKATAAEAGIKQNIGSHSLRKTFGYWVWHNAEDKNEALCILQMVFNHSSPATTAKYIGITDGEIKNAFNSIALGIE